MTNNDTQPERRHFDMTRQDAARTLGVSPRTIDRWKTSGLLEFVRDPMSGRVRFRSAQVRAMRDGGSRTRPERWGRKGSRSD